jgi:hypothetical protein
LGINEKWQDVIDHLSPLPVSDNLYLFTENTTDSYTNPMNLNDHPIVLGIAGFLPISDRINKEILKNSLNEVIEKWNWKTAWGWDFPLSAMCATVLDEPEKAIDLLMMDTYKNKYLMNCRSICPEMGDCFQQLLFYVPIVMKREKMGFLQMANGR